MANKYAILIGINGYHESLGRLKYCVNDVRRLADVLTQGGDAFPKDRLLVLTDDGEQDKCPTYANIHSWLASYLAQAEDDDTVFVYFAGHGRGHGGKAYLLPSDATLQTVHVTGIAVSYVQELLERCKARQKVLVLDACHSGAGRDVAAMSTGMLNELSGGKGIYTITSCDASELSHEWGEQKHGVFSYFLSEGLSGGCPPDAQNRVTAEALYEWVYDRVRNWARNHRCTQTPKRFSAGSGAVVLGQGSPSGKSAARPSLHRSHEKIFASPKAASTALPDGIPAWFPFLLCSLRNVRNYVFLMLLGFSLVAVLMLILMDGTLDSNGSAVTSWPVGVGILTLDVVAFLVWFGVQYWRTRNRYVLTCAERSLAGNDLVRASSYALDLRRLGIDRAKGGALLVTVAQENERAGERGTAEHLLRKAAWRWRDAHARKALSKRAAKKRHVLSRVSILWALSGVQLLLAGLSYFGLMDILPLLLIVAFSVAMFGTGCFLFFWRLRGTLAASAAILLLTITMGTVVIPLGRALVFNKYRLRALSLSEQGKMSEALSLLHKVDKSLSTFTHEELRQSRDLLATTRKHIRERHASERGVWAEGDTVFRWRDGSERAEQLMSFSSIERWSLSPDERRIAFAVDGGKQIYLIDKHTMAIMALTPRAPAGSHYDLGGWKDSTTLFVGDDIVRLSSASEERKQEHGQRGTTALRRIP